MTAIGPEVTLIASLIDKRNTYFPVRTSLASVCNVHTRCRSIEYVYIEQSHLEINNSFRSSIYLLELCVHKHGVQEKYCQTKEGWSHKFFDDTPAGWAASIGQNGCILFWNPPTDWFRAASVHKISSILTNFVIGRQTPVSTLDKPNTRNGQSWLKLRAIIVPRSYRHNK